jgi:thiamine biosynthesis lipoprotein
VPAEDQIAKALAGADLAAIHISGQKVQLPKGVRIDLGGIAKGYICDKVAERLRECGVKSALLNFGGNVVTVGARPDGSPWRVGLQLPQGQAGKDFFAVVESVNGTVVTSGVYERGFDADGVRHHHILDPRSGYPVQNGLVSVTVTGTGSLMADGLATAAFVLGRAEGQRLAASYGYQCVFRMDDGSVGFTPGLPITVVR